MGGCWPWLLALAPQVPLPNQVWTCLPLPSDDGMVCFLLFPQLQQDPASQKLEAPLVKTCHVRKIRKVLILGKDPRALSTCVTYNRPNIAVLSIDEIKLKFI